MTVTTPLGPDVLLLVGFSGHEAISQPFTFELDLAAEDQSLVDFEKLLGRKITVNLTLPEGQKRHFSGICTSLTQGMRGIDHTAFQMEISPYLWLLTRRVRSRIFQNSPVPEILKSVLDIPDVVYDLEGTYHPRTYCVQYRETDFHFVSRLMEEEGIHYYFKHRADGHQMVVSDKAAFPELQPAELILQQAEGTHVQEQRISRWQKRQQLRSHKITLRDYHFEMPQQSLEAGQDIQDDVKVGKVTHKLKVGDSDGLEIYDWPGGYARRFDAIDRGGTDRPDELQKLLKDNERTAKIRMEQEAADSIAIRGASRYRHLVSGHTFSLKEQVVVPYAGSSSHEGKYVLTSINHSARMSGSYRSGDAQEILYDNSFTCIPAGLRYRPQRTTPKPVIMGTQTAVVVGPKGEDIHIDKYGRVKVQFHWDRQGKMDADSSCWIRVSQIWAGKNWGAFFWPRVGHEVVVTFEEGDPDRPLIIGSAYNADNMPPFGLPKASLFSGFKSSTTRGTVNENFNGILFVDVQGHEHLAIHSERHMVLTSELDKLSHAGRHKTERVSSASMFTVGALPGGGGSGGGPKELWPQPEPIAVAGLNSVMVYGENLQVAMPLNHQLAVGSNLQLCINPAGLAAGVPGYPGSVEATGLLGGGAGGNMQFTIGTSANIVLGREFDINFAPDKISDVSPKLELLIYCGIIGALGIAWPIVYAGIGDDTQRANWSLLFQGVLDVLLSTLSYKVTATKIPQNGADEAFAKVFGTSYFDQMGQWHQTGIYLGLQELGLLAAAMGVIVLPPVLASNHEDWSP
jgi:type VI secretion system secreted protein VgrG